MRLKNIIEENDSAGGLIFDLFIQVLILTSVISFSIETLPDLRPDTVKWLNIIEYISISIFTLEYLMRIVVSDNKLKFILSFYGLIDLLAIIPFYISSGIDLRSIRIIRMMRLFRIFKLFRYSRALKRFYRAFYSIREELVLFLFASAFMLYFAAVGIYYFEHEVQPGEFSSIFHCLWWAVTTLTTVGYGDIYPMTIGGKIFTFVILMIGLGVVAVPTGLIASALAKTNK